MKKQLSSREILLIGILLVLVVVGGYLLLFYMPMTQELERLQAEKVSSEEQLTAAAARVEEKKRMEKELKAIFDANPNPLGLAPYDNQKPVMFELNSILRTTAQYSLSFGSVDAGGGNGLVRRQISLSYSCTTYEDAKKVLQRLHDSSYRCLLGDLSVSLDGTGGQTGISATLTFFEYQEAKK